ncbi:MAG: hypothetical protein ACK6BC_07595 [Cyanobacteriota bacterium]|jgi:hypothetical protein
MSRTVRWVLGLLLAAGLVLSAFLLLPFSSWLPGGTVANLPSRQVVNGPAFNRLFPKPQRGETLIFSQEKRGFSQARLKVGDSTRALLSISDVITAPEARDKFSGASQLLGSWPLVEQGPQASALLVADRFQVKVIGQGDGLDPQTRHALLGAFDLPGLAALNPAAQPSRALPARQADPLRLPAPDQRQKDATDQRTPVLEPAA